MALKVKLIWVLPKIDLKARTWGQITIFKVVPKCKTEGGGKVKQRKEERKLNVYYCCGQMGFNLSGDMMRNCKDRASK